MTRLDDRRAMALTDRLEWRQDGEQPSTLTARRFERGNDEDVWVATKCGVYLSRDALIAKHWEMIEARPRACVIRLSISEFDWVSRAERNGKRVA